MGAGNPESYPSLQTYTGERPPVKPEQRMIENGDIKKVYGKWENPRYTYHG
jgi:hypothetical protein